MNTLKFHSLWGVGEWAALTGVQSFSAKRIKGVWNVTYDANKLN